MNEILSKIIATNNAKIHSPLNKFYAKRLKKIIEKDGSLSIEKMAEIVNK